MFCTWISLFSKKGRKLSGVRLSTTVHCNHLGKKNCGLNTRGPLSLCFELFYWQEVWNDNCLYEKSCHSYHLISWSWQAEVNENSFYLKLWRMWMGSTARFLQTWKRSIFLINICLFLFLLMLQNSVYTSFCVIDLLLCCYHFYLTDR